MDTKIKASYVKSKRETKRRDLTLPIPSRNYIMTKTHET